MAKKMKFPLEMKEGKAVRSVEELRENMDCKKFIEYFMNGKLEVWLRNWYYDDLADAIATIQKNDSEGIKQACKVLDVEFNWNSEQIKKEISKNERIDLLKKITDSAEIIQHIDQVAFNQKELEELLKSGEKLVYLCGDKFSISAKYTDVKFVGVNKPEIDINETKAKQLEESQFQNVRLSKSSQEILGMNDMYYGVEVLDKNVCDYESVFFSLDANNQYKEITVIKGNAELVVRFNNRLIFYYKQDNSYQTKGCLMCMTLDGKDIKKFEMKNREIDDNTIVKIKSIYANNSCLFIVCGNPWENLRVIQINTDNEIVNEKEISRDLPSCTDNGLYYLKWGKGYAEKKSIQLIDNIGKEIKICEVDGEFRRLFQNSKKINLIKETSSESKNYELYLLENNNLKKITDKSIKYYGTFTEEKRIDNLLFARESFAIIELNFTKGKLKTIIDFSPSKSDCSYDILKAIAEREEIVMKYSHIANKKFGVIVYNSTTGELTTIIEREGRQK